MKRLVVITISVAVLLLLGALFGVQQINERLGISQPEPLPIESKEVEKKHTSPKIPDELQEKSERIEEVGRFNFFSEMGSYLADGLNYGSRALLSQVMSFVHQVLNGEKANS